jgi:hypothetical protein
MWTTDPDQARGGLLLWWKKLNKIPFLVQTHKEATPYTTIGGHPQRTVPSAWDRNHIPCPKRNWFCENIKVMQTEDNVKEDFTHCFFLLGVIEETHWIT